VYNNGANVTADASDAGLSASYDNTSTGSKPVTVRYANPFNDSDSQAAAYTVTVNPFTAAFNRNGGDTGAVPASINVHALGATATLPETDPTRNGWTFTGWNAAANGSEDAFDETTPVYAHITVYAQWEATVTFNANEGNWDGSDTPQTRTVTHAANTVNLLPDDPERSGWTFTGWNAADDGSGTAFSTGTAVSGHITVFAIWGSTVTFNANNTDVTGYNHTRQVVPPETSVGTANMPPAPSATGGIFNGWNTAANGSGTTFDGITPVTGHITVFAQWTPVIYTVTFDSNGGSAAVPSTLTVPHGTPMGRPSNPVRSGWYFGGWFRESDLVNEWNIATDTVTADTTLYALWLTMDEADFGHSVLPGDITTITVASGTDWTNAVTTINSGGQNRNYIINITSDIQIAGHTASTFTPQNIRVSIRGEDRRLSLNSFGTQGSILNIITADQRVTLRGVTLYGHSGNNRAMVFISSNAHLTMQSGAIRNNNNLQTSAVANGGGVYIDGSGSFTMNGGEISNNLVQFDRVGGSNTQGGGVFLMGTTATFTMNGGSIHTNTANSRENAPNTNGHAYGGGVFISGGTMIMNGGEILNNSAMSQRGQSHGGGVYVGAAFFLTAGTISDNRTLANIGPTSGSQMVTFEENSSYGTFLGPGGTWVSNGNLVSTNDPVNVVNGELQP